MARFKFEYPWELSFAALSQDHPDRQFFQDLRPVDQLMEEMAADPAMETEVTPNDTLVAFASQGTKRQHSSGTEGTFDSLEPKGEPDLTKEDYHPFDSQRSSTRKWRMRRSATSTAASTSLATPPHSGRSGSKTRSCGTWAVRRPRQSSRASPVPSFRLEVSASALRPDLPALSAFSVPLSQRATKKGSEFILKHASTPPIGEPGALSHPRPLFHIGSHSSVLCSDFSGLRNVPFGDEVQTTNTHHTHFHTLTPNTPHPTHTRSQHKRSLRSRDARQRRAKQRIQNRATHRRNCRSRRSALTPTPHIVPSQGTGSLGQPHRQKPLYDLTGRTLSHRRLQQQRSRQQQQHTQSHTIFTSHSQQHSQMPQIPPLPSEPLQSS